MDADRTAERDFVVRTAQENDVKFIRLWFTDILGHLKGFAITVEDLEDAIEQGVGFDGAAIEGFARIDESDMRAFPDPTTFTLLPWRPRQNAVASMFCDIRTPQGEAFIGDPRYALKRNLERLAKSGYTYYVGPEIEFFYLKDSQTPEPLDQQGYYDQVSSYPAADLRRETVLNLGDMGIPVKYSHHEGAHSQHEIDLQYTDALTMADNVMTAKLVIKELAQLKSAYASFMPKPISGMNGSGMHVHQSLFQGDKNIFFDLEDEHQLSITGKRFIAGLLHHAPEITLITNQWVTPYKRLCLDLTPRRSFLGHMSAARTLYVFRPISRATRVPCEWSTELPTQPAILTWHSACCLPPGSKVSSRSTRCHKRWKVMCLP